MSQFAFLEAEFEDQFDAAERAERYALSDPGTSIIHARRALEIGIRWMFRSDRDLPDPYDNNLNAYLHVPEFKTLAEGRVFNVSRKIQKAGNRAAHEARQPTQYQALEIVSALYQFCLWMAWTYGRTAKPDLSVTFDPTRLHDPGKAEASTLQERRDLEERLEQEAHETELARHRLAEATRSIEQLEAEHKKLQAEVAAAKKEASAVPVEAMDWSEAETRKKLIDKLLSEAGHRGRKKGYDHEYEVPGMPNKAGKGYVDYVLWGDDGLPLAVVEAKKALKSPLEGKQQAKLYADALEAETGQRPIMYYTNGYETWMWDGFDYPAHQVQGFHTKDELALLIQRRSSRESLAALDINNQIVERHYQHRAIRAIGEHFEKDKEHKALIVMATGAGKTRTVIALVDLLMRAKWAKRVLFLADRTALVNQAVNAFKSHLPNSAPVNLVTDGDENGRVYVSTYQTMVGKIDELNDDNTRRFGVGYFDLVVIDEAHRSVYRKYRGIFEYFDSLLVGLTATPRDEVDKNTYDLFDLETGVPTDVYELDQAVDDGFLVPPRTESVPLKFVRQGIKYGDLSEDERDEWDELEWGLDDDGVPIDPPDEVNAAQINKWLFNEDTVDKVLKHLMTHGIKVAGGDRLGKTIIFAKNQAHAEYVQERFDANYPALGATGFARTVTYKVNYAQSLIDDFSNKEKSPHIAISVDMLDTGIDVPEVVNLVYFKPVYSKTKFWQMLGRGTRLCPNLFGPGEHKAQFKVFDFCQNLEYFSQAFLPVEGSSGASLSEQIFKVRLELLQQLDSLVGLDDERAEVAKVLRERVASMNADNFLVRPHLDLVNRFKDAEAWEDVKIGDLSAMAERLAALPAELESEQEQAKRFDILVLNAELAQLSGGAFDRQRQRIIRTCNALEELGESIPAVAQHMALIVAAQTDEWWANVSYQMLEDLRKKLRSIVHLIKPVPTSPLYSDFADEIGEGSVVELPGLDGSVTHEFAQFRKKAQHYLKEHLDQPAVVKVREGKPLNDDDIGELQDVLESAGIGGTDEFEAAAEKAGSFGLFIRSLVGLDRAAAKAAFADFLDDSHYSKNQIEFVNLIINYLTEYGAVDPGKVYESPFTAVAPEGPEGLFGSADVTRIFEVIDEFTKAAA